MKLESHIVVRLFVCLSNSNWEMFIKEKQSIIFSHFFL